MNLSAQFLKPVLLIAWLALHIAAHGQYHEVRSEINREVMVPLPVEYKYILSLPEAEDPSGSLPLIVFLHGAGERGDNTDLVKVHGPWKFLEENPQFRFILLAPQCRAGEVWDPRKLDILVDEIISTYPVDTTRIYLTGLSMGGYGTWDLAMHHPSRFAAIAPVCGSTSQHRLMAHKVKDIPIWVFHGALDDVVPFEFSARVVKRLKELEADVTFTVYPFTGHDAWNETYTNSELYKWFLSHSKGLK